MSEVSDDAPTLASYCVRCGAQLPLWFDPPGTIYDVAKDDAEYAAWLDTPCKKCRTTPRENGAR